MPSERYHVERKFAFIGRTFEEYRTLFDLSLADLRGKAILDCPGGPSAFTAVASLFDASVTAVDPEYGPPAETLARTCTDAVERTIDQLAEKRDLFVWEYYGDVETRGRYLRAAAERFLADYALNPGRYVQSRLPSLPFETDAFDLTLSANLLFLYDDRLDVAFHTASLRELARVSSDEVRVFPLHSLDGEQSAILPRVTGSLEADGLRVGVRDVPYEFQPGATEMLVVSDSDTAQRPTDN